ncbi:MAG: copper amine oxidase N-terminal domain-containing protein, partial [Oscillospiraceae bacterium]|nr:copper amine oxidase N-terminal domain-containing protein [Oscillospiraceae bacterium]
PIAHDASLDPVTVPRGEPLTEQEDYAYIDFPICLRPLMEALGGTFEEGPEPGQFTCTYRGKTIVFDPESPEVTLEGKTRPTSTHLSRGETPVPYLMQGIQEGEPVILFSLIKDTWALDGSVSHSQSVPNPEISDFGDWYIIP